MKNLHFFSILIGAIIGIVATIIISKYLIHEKKYSAFPAEKIELKEIKESDSEKAIGDYISLIDKDTKTDSCDYKWAINVSKQQYEVMAQAISRMTPDQKNDISGFRLYFGRIPPRNYLFSYLVYIDNAFVEKYPPYGALASQIFPEQYAQECPPFCNRQ
jgi:hypothetical protein